MWHKVWPEGVMVYIRVDSNSVTVWHKMWPLSVRVYIRVNSVPDLPSVIVWHKVWPEGVMVYIRVDSNRSTQCNGVIQKVWPEGVRVFNMVDSDRDLLSVMVWYKMWPKGVWVYMWMNIVTDLSNVIVWHKVWPQGVRVYIRVKWYRWTQCDDVTQSVTTGCEGLHQGEVLQTYPVWWCDTKCDHRVWESTSGWSARHTQCDGVTQCEERMWGSTSGWNATDLPSVMVWHKVWPQGLRVYIRVQCYRPTQCDGVTQSLTRECEGLHQGEVLQTYPVWWCDTKFDHRVWGSTSGWTRRLVTLGGSGKSWRQRATQ